MAITNFVQLGPLPDSADNYLSTETEIREVAENVQGTSQPKNFLIGTIIQDNKSLQVISEGPKVPDAVTEPTSKTDILPQAPHTTFRVAFERSLFKPDGPATGKVVEYVQHFFPASQATPEFRTHIEQDFLKFNEGFSKGVEGRIGWIFGWTMDELDHAEITDGKAVSFIIVVGWESMEAFERSLEREAFKNSIGILIAWKAPYKMWHSERKALL